MVCLLTRIGPSSQSSSPQPRLYSGSLGPCSPSGQGKTVLTTTHRPGRQRACLLLLSKKRGRGTPGRLSLEDGFAAPSAGKAGRHLLLAFSVLSATFARSGLGRHGPSVQDIASLSDRLVAGQAPFGTATDAVPMLGKRFRAYDSNVPDSSILVDLLLSSGS